MEALIGVGLIAACCGVPLLVLGAASLFKRKPLQRPDTSASLENGRSRTNRLPDNKPGSRLEGHDRSGRNV